MTQTFVLLSISQGLGFLNIKKYQQEKKACIKKFMYQNRNDSVITPLKTVCTQGMLDSND